MHIKLSLARALVIRDKRVILVRQQRSPIPSTARFFQQQALQPHPQQAPLPRLPRLTTAG